jgi:hypothetical protein
LHGVGTREAIEKIVDGAILLDNNNDVGYPIGVRHSKGLTLSGALRRRRRQSVNGGVRGRTTACSGNRKHKANATP